MQTRSKRGLARLTDVPWLAAGLLALVACYGSPLAAVEVESDYEEIEVEYDEWDDYWAWDDSWADGDYADADEDGIYEAYDYDYVDGDYDYDYVYDNDYGWTDNDLDDVEYDAEDGWHEQEWYDPSDWEWDGDDYDDEWEW